MENKSLKERFINYFCRDKKRNKRANLIIIITLLMGLLFIIFGKEFFPYIKETIFVFMMILIFFMKIINYLFSINDEIIYSNNLAKVILSNNETWEYILAYIIIIPYILIAVFFNLNIIIAIILSIVLLLFILLFLAKKIAHIFEKRLKK